MKAKYILSCLIAAVGLSMASCDDRLDIPKNGNMGGQEEFYQTDSDAEQAVASMFTSWGDLYPDWFTIKNLMSDDVWTGGGDRGDVTNQERLNEFTFDTDSEVVKSVFKNLYTLIYKANLIIERVNPDTPVKAQAVAEATFVRGWAHMELASLFGTAPVVDHLLQSDEYRRPNSTPEELWGQAEKDLLTAINSNNLPSKSGANDAMGAIRITKEVAQAVLGKVYVFQGKYAEGAEILDKVIASGKYDLYRGDLDKLCHAAANNCSEAMIEIQERNDPERLWKKFNFLYCQLGWRTAKMDLGSLKGVLAEGTYGFQNPTKAAYDAFVAAEGKDGYRLNSSIRHHDALKAQYGFSLRAGERLVGHEGYFNWKYRATADDLVQDLSFLQIFQYINPRVMRYAEVLLLAAEAHVQNGAAGRALPYINAVRERARLTPLAAVTLEDVKTEKRLEFFSEGLRYQDLVRWGDAEKYLSEKGKKVPMYTVTGVTADAYTNPDGGYKPKHALLPIPRQELELNPNIKQNPGW